MNNEYSQTRDIALAILNSAPEITADTVSNAVTRAMAGLDQGVVDGAALLRDIQSECNIWVPSAQVLDVDEDHVPWLDARRSEIAWNFWDRYRRHLGHKRWNPVQIRNIDKTTDRVLSLFEDPSRPGAWDRRGMVVGQVQSGKTANYTGVIAKAADAGYRLIVVLAGMHNSLRSQTQQRLDWEFLGFDTRSSRSFDQTNARVGVGKFGKFLHVHSLTNSDERGDFQARVARQMWVQIGGNDPVLLVVKKNATVLRNLYQWATSVQSEIDPGSGLPVVRGIPLLVIDDEADNASVNTKARPLDENGDPLEEYDPTRINGWIRKLLRTFEQSSYLAYTATPFANIFIDADESTTKYGEDLFPRSFIVNLRPPANYVGATKVFGLATDSSAGIEGHEGIPVVRSVDDHETWIPDKHRKDWVPSKLPQSLKDAVYAFLMATAVRRLRSQEEHNSMLVHVTRFTAVQALVYRDLTSNLELVRQRLHFGDESDVNSPWHELRRLWENDFVPTYAAMMRVPDVVADIGHLPEWSAVRSAVVSIIDEVTVRVLNGTSEDSLAYIEAEKPLVVIAIGGDKLSRGLTLEGLTVSYYLRASKMYDTLMQMGRWFGYRPGYLDVCRLYTTGELARWYRDIALANEELLREFEFMTQLGKTPQDYGLRVRAHPDGLMITARAKMRNSTEVDLSFSHTISETIYFDTDEATLRKNLETTRSLLGRLGAPSEDGELRTKVWKGVTPDAILGFLDSYSATDVATKAQPKALADYIRTLAYSAEPELTSWTVALISVSNAPHNAQASIGSLTVGLVERAHFVPEQRRNADSNHQSSLTAGRDNLVLRRLVSPTDELRDLTQAEVDLALAKTREAWRYDQRPTGESEPSRPSGMHIRAVRGPQRGLLLLYPLKPKSGWMIDGLPPIGFAISFPPSNLNRTVSYRVTNRWWADEYGDLTDDTQ